MYYKKTKSIFLENILSFSKENGFDKKEVQIKIKRKEDTEDKLCYFLCHNLDEIEEKKLMELTKMKFDFLNIESGVEFFINQVLYSESIEFESTQSGLALLVYIHPKSEDELIVTTIKDGEPIYRQSKFLKTIING